MIDKKKIEQANKGLPTVDIKGKEYVMVKDRVKAFREVFSDFGISTEVVALTDESVTIKATVTDENGIVKATGLAQESKSASFINKTSFVENCETSAIGRALAMLGIGIDDSIGSADEVATAINQQNAKPKPASEELITQIKTELEETNSNVANFLKIFKVSSVDEMSEEQAKRGLQLLADKKEGKR